MDDPWPLRHLVLRTPRLMLRPDDDAGLLELAEEARLGVHPPELMPFITPWSVSPSAGWPNSAARLASASMLHAPSSSEYSEWTWRWATAGVLTGCRG